MIRESETFNFSGVDSSYFNIYNVNINQNSNGGGLSEPFAATTTLHKISIPRISKNYLQFTEKAPFSFTLEFYLDDVWNSENIDKIKRWLFQDTYREMTFSQEEFKIYDVIAVGDVTLTHDSNGHGSILIQFECKNYYSHSAVQGQNTDYDFSSGSGTVQIQNLGSLDCFPEIWLQKIGNGAISIINHSDNDNKLEFYPASKATGILTCNGTLYDGELIDVGNDVYEIFLRDETLPVGTHQAVVGQPAVNNIKIDLTGQANFAYGILRFQDGYVQNHETITIGSDTYEFSTDGGIYSKNDIPVDISKYCTTASYKFDLDSNSPSNKFNIFTKSVTIQNTQYNFEQGTDEWIMKVNHGLDVNADTSNYRIINVCEYPEFQKYADPNDLANGYVDRTIFHNMKPITVLDSAHLAVPNLDQSKQGATPYLSDSNQTPYSDTNKQEINIYTYDPCGIRLVAWQNDGAILYVPDSSLPSIAHAGSVLELQSNNIVDASGNIVYTGRKFYVGIQKIQIGIVWNNIKISKVYLMSYQNGTGGTDYPKIENDLPYTTDKNNIITPNDLWYTDSGDNGIVYPSGYSFPCNRWENSLTQTANTTITAIINHVKTGNNSNTDTHSLPLLGADLSKSNTILCGLTMDITMQNFADAINVSATIAGSEYSTDITTANKYVSAQKMEMDNSAYGNTIPYVLLTSKLAGTDGNNIEVKITNNVTGNVEKGNLHDGHGCTSNDAERELIRAMAKNYQLNPSFTANVDRYYPVYLVNGVETRVSVDSNGLLPSESTGAWSTLQSWVTVRAMIAGSHGNNILVASNTSVASWGKANNGDIIISFIGGNDPSDISAILNTIITAINTNGNGYSANVINSNQIQIIYNTTGQQGNVPVSTTCFNISFDSYRLNGGLDELRNLELVYINCKEGEEYIESSLQIPRYDNSNLNFLKLIYGNNDLEIQGACKIRFLYQYRYR